MSANESPSLDRVRSLIRVRQFREFTDEPVEASQVDAIADVARWSGSASNSQPWRFIVVRDGDVIGRIATAGLPHTRALETATAVIAVALPGDPDRQLTEAFDEGRAAERMLIAASLVGLGAGIAWIPARARDAIGDILALPDDRFVRTVVALGHPSPAARQPKAAPGQARLPREQVVFEQRWPED